MHKIDLTGLKTSEKLDTWADVAEKVRPEAFEMDVVLKFVGTVAPELEELTLETVAPCGTAACLTGTAGVAFRGLTVIPPEEDDPWCQRWGARVRAENCGCLEDFFGVTYSEFFSLTEPSEYGPGDRDVQGKIPQSVAIGRVRALAESYRARGE